MDADELRRRREKIGLTQSELGRLFGVPQNTISRWERGETRIQHPKLIDLALEAIEKRAIWIDLTEAMRRAKIDGES